jgi:hypothetical protein
MIVLLQLLYSFSVLPTASYRITHTGSAVFDPNEQKYYFQPTMSQAFQILSTLAVDVECTRGLYGWYILDKL